MWNVRTLAYYFQKNFRKFASSPKMESMRPLERVSEALLVVYGCPSRTACVHHALDRHMFILTDQVHVAQAHTLVTLALCPLRPCTLSVMRALCVLQIHECAKAPRGPRQVRLFTKFHKTMHVQLQKMIQLLHLLRRAYDAQYYVKLDDDVDIASHELYEHTLLTLRPRYYGTCSKSYSLLHTADRHIVRYVESTYALSNASVGVLTMRGLIPGVLQRFDDLFRSLRNRTRRRAEDSVVGAALYFGAGTTSTCTNMYLFDNATHDQIAKPTLRLPNERLPHLPHGCKSCDYT